MPTPIAGRSLAGRTLPGELFNPPFSSMQPV